MNSRNTATRNMKPLKQPRVLFSIAGNEVTLREFLLAIVILIFGVMVTWAIVNSTADYYQQESQKYHTAIIISEPRTLKYALDTNAGRALVSGDFSASTPVQSTDIYGDFSALTKYVERYTKHMHTRTLHDSKGRTIGTQIYYTYSWDDIENTAYATEKLIVHDQALSTSLLSQLPWTRIKIDESTVKAGACAKVSWGYLYQQNHWMDLEGDIRWYFTGVAYRFPATIFVNCADGQMRPVGNSHTIETIFTLSTDKVFETVDARGSTAQLLITIFFSLLFLASAVGFVLLRNQWLNGQTKV